MDLRRAKLFTTLPVHCFDLFGVWNWSSCQHSGFVVWAVYLVKITLRLVRCIFRRDQRIPCWPVWVKLSYW